MDKLVIYGGRKLSGKIHISGAKNAVLPMMAAALLAPGKYTISNVPHLRDTFTMLKVMKALGAEGSLENHTLYLDTSNCDNPVAPYELVKTMRASFYVLGPLLSRFKMAKVSLPGGCAWGPRPVNLHIKGMELLGADINLESGYIVARADQLKGTVINLDISSVGATGNTIMAAVCAEGTTTITNAAREPEIASLSEFLNSMGADISGIGTDALTIRGVDKLHPVDFQVIPDRIEAGTYLLAGAMCGDGLEICDLQVDHLSSILAKLKEAGVPVEIGSDWIKVSCPGKPLPVDVTTAVYPGFPTDMQAQWMAVMCVSQGSSVIVDEVYMDRFTHVPELIRLGADIKLDKNVAVISGVEELIGAQVMSTDIRASASLILAGLIAEGRTDVYRVYHIDRGYEQIEEKLRAVGAEIYRKEAETI